MPNDWLQTAQQLADLMRELREAPNDSKFRYVRFKIRRFLESHGCTVMPWADARTSRRSRHIRDAAAAYDQEASGEIAQSEGERIIYLGFNGGDSSAETVGVNVELSPSTAKGGGDVHGGNQA